MVTLHRLMFGIMLPPSSARKLHLGWGSRSSVTDCKFRIWLLVMWHSPLLMKSTSSIQGMQLFSCELHVIMKSAGDENNCLPDGCLLQHCRKIEVKQGNNRASVLCGITDINQSTGRVWWNSERVLFYIPDHQRPSAVSHPSTETCCAQLPASSAEPHQDPGSF